MPILLLDDQLRVSRSNRAHDATFGAAISGSSWTKEFVHSDDVLRVETALREEHARGGGREIGCRIVSHDGRELMVRLEFNSIATPPGVLVRVLSWKLQHASDPDLRERTYDVSTFPVFGALLRDSKPTSELCYARFHRRDRPCVTCPARFEVQPARVVVAGDARDGEIEFVRTRTIADHVVRVHVQVFSRRLVSEMFRARIDQLAANAGLSTREREVIDLVLLGASLDEISETLGISERTVKFHQTNALRKLNTETRAGLFRLLF